jgi:outer membrane protein assembly factor BamB
MDEIRKGPPPESKPTSPAQIREGIPPDHSGSMPAAVPPSMSVALPARVWPGAVIVVLMWLFILVPAYVVPNTMMHFYSLFMSGMVAALLINLWWLLGSRVRLYDRLSMVAAFVVFGVLMAVLADPSFGGFAIIIYTLRAVVTVWVVYLLLTAFLPWNVRRAGLFLALGLAWCTFDLMRFDGVYGDMTGQLSYRWAARAEDLHKAALESGKIAEHSGAARISSEPLVLSAGDWPSFRGPDRDGHLSGVKIVANWNTDKGKPKLLWKHLVGPNWSSHAVIGKHVFTQEQWHQDEVVVCYHADTGDILWKHIDQARFTEPVAGPGPRATPTFHDGKIYALGATGILNCLDAATGAKAWSRDVLKDVGLEKPQMWGFASSPLVAHGKVSVVAGGPDGKSVAAYDAQTGTPAWFAGQGQLSYCSPQLTTIAGTEMVLIATDAGASALDPRDGKELWQFSWPIQDMARITQPALVDGSDLLVGTGFNIGTKRLSIAKNGTDWSVKEKWHTMAIKPYYNDFVVYQDHLYGFDGEFLICVKLSDGKKRWRERGYGNGQVLLLADQGVLLVQAERGAVALVEAKPDACNELCRFEALAGKTWNHPVVANGRLYVRNGEEMACYEVELEAK